MTLTSDSHRYSRVAVVGAQWGDEGKGKIVDLYSEKADIIVRYQGGNNAGHTIIVNGQKSVLHLIPSGVLHPHKLCVLGNGVVIDVEVFLGEVEALKTRGILDASRGTQIVISDRAHVIFPFHRALDRAREDASGKAKIGTTLRGIGPCYEDKAARRGIMVGDLLHPELLKGKIEKALTEKNTLLKTLYQDQGPSFNADELTAWALALGEKLRPMIVDTRKLLQSALKNKKSILFEGAQGSLLDLDHGTYPYVTSSNTTLGGLLTGCGLGPQAVSHIIGIAKAYTTRVGSGPFPTELCDDRGEALRQKGHEFGSTTGRPRRTGWLDLVALKYAVELNGCTGLALMKADVLTGLSEIEVCTGYELIDEKNQVQVLDSPPSHPAQWAQVRPIYQKLQGWDQWDSHAQSRKDLPKNFQKYVEFIEEYLQIPIVTLSLGPGREETIHQTVFQD